MTTQLWTDGKYRLMYDGVDSVYLEELEGTYAPYRVSTACLSPMLSRSWSSVMFSIATNAAYRMKVVNHDAWRWVRSIPQPETIPWMNK